MLGLKIVFIYTVYNPELHCGSMSSHNLIFQKGNILNKMLDKILHLHAQYNCVLRDNTKMIYYI